MESSSSIKQARYVQAVLAVGVVTGQSHLLLVIEGVFETQPLDSMAVAISMGRVVGVSTKTASLKKLTTGTNNHGTVYIKCGDFCA